MTCRYSSEETCAWNCSRHSATISFSIISSRSEGSQEIHQHDSPLPSECLHRSFLPWHPEHVQVSSFTSDTLRISLPSNMELSYQSPKGPPARPVSESWLKTLADSVCHLHLYPVAASPTWLLPRWGTAGPSGRHYSGKGLEKGRYIPQGTHTYILHMCIHLQKRHTITHTCIHMYSQKRNTHTNTCTYSCIQTHTDTRMQTQM